MIPAPNSAGMEKTTKLSCESSFAGGANSSLKICRKTISQNDMHDEGTYSVSYAEALRSASSSQSSPGEEVFPNFLMFLFL